MRVSPIYSITAHYVISKVQCPFQSSCYVEVSRPSHDMGRLTVNRAGEEIQI